MFSNATQASGFGSYDRLTQPQPKHWNIGNKSFCSRSKMLTLQFVIKRFKKIFGLLKKKEEDDDEGCCEFSGYKEKRIGLWLQNNRFLFKWTLKGSVLRKLNT